MTLLRISFIFSLLGGFPVQSKDCELPINMAIDNSTMPKVFGKWYYLGGATNNTEYYEDMTQIDNSVLDITPHNQNGFAVKEYYLRKKCFQMEANYSLSESNNEFIIEGDPDMKVQFVILKPDDFWVLIYNEFRKDNFYQGIFLNARNRTTAPENMMLLKYYAACVGLKASMTVFFPGEKDECPKEEKQRR